MVGFFLWIAISFLSASAHAGELYVRVTDALGHDLENVEIAITPVGGAKDQKKARHNKPFLIRRPDKLGRFLFVRVQPGKHFLSAKHRAGPSSRLCYLKSEVQIDYPANVESHSVEITLRSVRRYKVSGRILGLKGLPPMQLVIFFEPQPYPGDVKLLFSRMAAFVETGGRFEVYVPRGRYGLRMGSVTGGMFGEIASTPGTLDVSQDREGLLLDRFGALDDP